jgi:hypothetical protein
MAHGMRGAGARLEVDGLLQQARDALHLPFDRGTGDAPFISDHDEHIRTWRDADGDATSDALLIRFPRGQFVPLPRFLCVLIFLVVFAFIILDVVAVILRGERCALFGVGDEADAAEGEIDLASIGRGDLQTVDEQAGAFPVFTKYGDLIGVCEEQLFLREKLRS